MFHQTDIDLHRGFEYTNFRWVKQQKCEACFVILLFIVNLLKHFELFSDKVII